ncbi:cation:dicarboxylase symporter family transporter, partial [Lutibacter sp. B2]|nr:cation:dicarboxylase symporter family transporter [Lutibacter sp. B2]
MKNLINKWNQISLVKRIIVGLIVGIILALTIPNAAKPIVILGSLFVGGLKAVAPILVFFLVMAAISQHSSGQKTNMKTIITLYLVGTFLAALVAVMASFIFPVSLTLVAGVENVTPPEGVVEVLKTLLMNLVD